MDFYTASDAYIAYLKQFDPKVLHNYNGQRPYVGIVFQINDHEYLAPLSSYKPKQDSIPGHRPTVHKIHEKGNPENKMGILQLNNMIPILQSEISVLDFIQQRPKYRNLLTKQHEYIISEQDNILEKARKLYMLVTDAENDYFCRISCNFRILEENYQDFK